MKKRLLTYALMLMVICQLSIVNCLTAQTNEQAMKMDSAIQALKENKLLWFENGLGLGGDGYAYNLGIQAQLTEDALITLKFDATEHNDVSVFDIPVDGADTKSIALEIGKVYRAKWGMITYSTGASLVVAKHYHYIMLPGSCLFILDCIIPPSYKTQTTRSQSIGLPLDFKVIFGGRYAGVVINPYLNLNFAKTYGGVTVNCAVGRLKNKK